MELRDQMMNAAYRMSEPQLKGRKTIRHCRKKKQDKNLNKDLITQEAGGYENEWMYILLSIYFALNTRFLL